MASSSWRELPKSDPGIC